jgi:type VI secretion system secreted protein VgrG
MAIYVQADRYLTVTTPLGPDRLLLRGFKGREAISEPFSFWLELMAVNDTEIPFDQLLGQNVTAHLGLPDDLQRHFSGICSRVSEGHRHRDARFTYYRMEIVPQFWLLTLRAQSRIFQQLSVPDILKQVLQGLDVVYQIEGTFAPRDYCVQYGETDFAFASRLMEEEGIYYFFTHTADDHQMVLANTPASHPDLADPSPVEFETSEVGERRIGRITAWQKTQALRPGKYTLRDHCFELPHDPLTASKVPPASVQAGEVEHRLRIGVNDRLEVYTYPGAYAQRFDGVDPGGGDRAADVQKIFQDNVRTVGIRMQEGSVPGLSITGAGHCRFFASGHKFSLSKHFDGDGSYVLVEVDHEANLGGDYTSGRGIDTAYENSFECIPSGVPFRPRRVTPKPVIHGTQTAVVVGPAGAEIFTDKYGRVKVQFHWDRQGKHDVGSSCWIRVAQVWAGKRWGASFWPRIGQEVVVAFEEGDPDRPIIIGSVYNADQMPAYLGKGPDSKHPSDNKVSGIKSNSTPGGVGFNELRFDDTKGKEEVFVHAEHDMDVRVKNDSRERIYGNRDLIVGWKKDGKGGGSQRELVHKDKHLHVEGNQVEQIEGNVQLLVGGGSGGGGGNQDIVIKQTKKELIEGENHLHVKSTRYEKVDGSQHLTVASDQQEKVGQNHALDAGMEIHLKAGMKVIIEAGVQLSLKGPGGFVDIGPSGVTIQGIMVLINSGGSAGSGSGSNPTAPQVAALASAIQPSMADDAKTGMKSPPPPPPPPKEETALDLAKKLIIRKGTADDKDAELVAKELAKFPKHVLKRMADQGTHVVVCRGSVTEYRTDLKGVRPRGWPPGSSWDNVPGLYDENKNEVIIATTGHGTKGGAHVPTTGEGHGSQNLVLHESAHALDKGGKGANQSAGADFNKARDADAKTLSPYESQAGAAGQEETYAESAARYYGGDPNDAKNHPELHKYWDSDPLKPKP